MDTAVETTSKIIPITLLGLLFALLLAADPAQAAEPVGNDALVAAGDAERDGNLAKANRLYRRAYEFNESKTKAVIGLARVLTDQGDSKEALQTLQEYLSDVNSFQIEVRMALVDLYLREKNFAPAAKELEKVVLLRPGYVPALERQGYLFFDQGDFASAIETFNSYLRTNSNSLKVRFQLSKAYLSLGKPSDAIRELKALSQDHPADVEIQGTLGDAFFNDKQYLEAERVYRYLIKLDGKSEKNLVRMGELADLLNKDQEALGFYKKAADFYPNSLETGLKLGRMYTKLGMTNAAEEEFKRELAVNAEFDPAAQELINLWYTQKRYDRAGAFLSEYTARFPNKVQANVMYAKLLVTIDRAEAADAIMKRSYRENPDDMDCAMIYAWIKGKLGKHSDAIDILSDAEKRNPDQMSIKFNLGLMYEGKGSFKNAIERYKQIPEGAPSYFKSRVNLALVLEKMGQPVEAVTILKSLMAADDQKEMLRNKIHQLELAIAGTPEDEANRKTAGDHSAGSIGVQE